ncbi:LacI family DNA-binding transcriptional regulator [Streptomyces sp. NPDC047046]|uniref:LacI family DNA-binding transcriptional regulator n=1 Tax=Streptomyces sp. NPDC047046 TaxID=3155378 RepID=UPI0033C5FE46
MTAETPPQRGRTAARRGRPSQPTILDVAALAGVSKSAVSKVFNNRPGISEATRLRILDAAGKLGWSPSASATALRGERTRTIGLVLGRDADLLTADPYFAELIAGMEQELGPPGYGLQLHLVGDDFVREEEVYERLARERRVDAFVLTESRIGDSRPALLRRLHVPGLLVGRPWQREHAEGLHYLHADEDLHGITEAVEHLIGLGHRSLAYVAGPDNRVHTVLRRRAVEATLARHGLRPHSVIPCGFGNATAAAVTERLFAADAEPPTAVLYPNDTMALTAIATLTRLGLRVPEDVSVVGYDDLALGVWLHPRLTTVSQNVQDIGRVAALRLLAVLGEDVPDPGRPPAPHLVVRESTGPADEAPGAPAQGSPRGNP